MLKSKFVPELSNLPLIYQGKTRDTFPCKSDDEMLIVATDRLSTHNIIHLSEVPYKGNVLTALTIFWLTDLLKKAGIKNHLVAYGVNIYNHLPGNRSDYPDDFHHRAIVVKKLSIVPVEFIYRGYLAGSLYRDYYKKGLPNPYGIIMSPGLSVMAPFPEPVFTPTEKSDTDEPLDGTRVIALYSQAYHVSFRAFILIRDHLRSLGLELVDSKFEASVDTLADEIVTPDSSRFCELSEIKLGKEPPWLDKQIARDEAERIWGSGPKHPLEFSSEIIHKLSETYLRICWRITGFHLPVFHRQHLDV